MRKRPKFDFKQWAKETWFWIRFRLRLVSKREVQEVLLSDRDEIFEEIPDPDARAEIRGLYHDLDDLKTSSDLPAWLTKTKAIGMKMEEISHKYGDVLGEETTRKINYMAGIDVIGWRPAGARIFEGFINPFQIFSFFAENHWSTKAAIDVIVTEVTSDGYILEPASDRKDVSPERYAQVEQILKALDMENLRLSILRHYLVYGNALILPHKNPLQNLQKLELLIMDRCYPVQDRIFEQIIGWDYWEGYNAHFYRKEDLFHLKAPSLKLPDLGIPPLASLVTDIESDLAASSLNGAVFHTAGTVGTILVTNDDPKVTAGKNMDTWARKLQKEIQLQWSGVHGAHGIMVTNFIKQAIKVAEIGGLEASFLTFREVVAKSICTVLRVPPEKLSINRSQGLQYQAALVEDSINKTFDKAITTYMIVIDNFINVILRELIGIDDVVLRAKRRFGGMTLNGAKMSKLAADTGIPLDANQHLEYFYGLPRFARGDKRGDILVDNSSNRDPKKLPPKFVGQLPGDYTDEEIDRAAGNDQESDDSGGDDDEEGEK